MVISCCVAVWHRETILEEKGRARSAIGLGPEVRTTAKPWEISACTLLRRNSNITPSTYVRHLQCCQRVVLVFRILDSNKFEGIKLDYFHLLLLDTSDEALEVRDYFDAKQGKIRN